MVHLKNKQQPKKKNADKMSKNTLFLRVKSILKSSMQNVNSLKAFWTLSHDDKTMNKAPVCSSALLHDPK